MDHIYIYNYIYIYIHPAQFVLNHLFLLYGRVSKIGVPKSLRLVDPGIVGIQYPQHPCMGIFTYI